jgi:hypothetical protein
MTAASSSHAGYRLCLVTVGPFLPSAFFSASSLAGAGASLPLSKKSPVFFLDPYFTVRFVPSGSPIDPS